MQLKYGLKTGKNSRCFVAAHCLKLITKFEKCVPTTVLASSCNWLVQVLKNVFPPLMIMTIALLKSTPQYNCRHNYIQPNGWFGTHLNSVSGLPVIAPYVT
eukprot:Lithocolla_globosa_v1_NODE_47_length_7891_cov_8.351582.p7 type:complete len:101 gc:universal NODE_47_length_7891_cov_8.351582:1410-1712(+)